MREEENFEDSRAIEDLFLDEQIKTLGPNSDMLISNSTLTANCLIPSCYYSEIPDWDVEKNIENYSEDVLFYIFYNHPGTELQILAYNRLLYYGFIYSETIGHFLVNDNDFTPNNRTIEITIFNQNIFKRSSLSILCDRKFYGGLKMTKY